MRVTSTSCTVVSWADTRSDSVIRCAITCRSRGIFTVVPGSGAPLAGVGSGRRSGACEAAAAGRAGAACSFSCSFARAAAFSAAARTSCLRIRPPTPEPESVDRSTPFSAASLRTSGVTYGARASPSAASPSPLAPSPAAARSGSASVRLLGWLLLGGLLLGGLLLGGLLLRSLLLRSLLLGAPASSCAGASDEPPPSWLA